MSSAAWGPEPGSAQRPWTEKEKRRLLVLVHDGADDDAIAAELGRTARGVAVKRQRLGLVVRKLDRSLGKISTQDLIAELSRRGISVVRRTVDDGRRRCHGCGKMMMVNQDGRLRSHLDGSYTCWASGEEPRQVGRNGR